MSAARSSSRRRPAANRRPGSGPSGRARTRPGREPGQRPQPHPLQPREARGCLAGLAMFAVGFAAAGVLVVAGSGSTPGYYVAISVGLLGIGVLGFFSRRVAAEVQPPAVWSPRGLSRVADGVGLPPRALVLGFYALLAVSVVGNVIVPLTGRR